MMDDSLEDFLKWIEADQEEAEFLQPKINRFQAEALALLRSLSNNWSPAADMANDTQERKTAVILLAWSGCVNMRFDVNLYSDATVVHAQVVATGYWTKAWFFNEAVRQLGSILGKIKNLQEDVKRDLRLTREGELCQFNLQKHPEKDWEVLLFVLFHRAEPLVTFRLLEAPAVPANIAVANAQASASVGDIIVQNQIVLGSQAEPARPTHLHPQADTSSGVSPTDGGDRQASNHATDTKGGSKSPSAAKERNCKKPRKRGRKKLEKNKVASYRTYVMAWWSGKYKIYADCAVNFGSRVTERDIAKALRYARKYPAKFPKKAPRAADK